MNSDIDKLRLNKLLEQRKSDPSVEINLFNSDLQGLDLPDTTLQNADLRNSRLNSANLRGAKLTRANLSGANLSGANLTGAILIGTNLSSATLTGAVLTGANLTGANLRGAIGANIQGARGRIVSQSRGPAFEVHNAFIQFKPIESEYLRLINMPDVTYSEPYDYIEDKFKSNIQRLFPRDDTKLEQFYTVFNKIKADRSIPTDSIDLIIKSIDFVFSQDDAFQIEYLLAFIEDTCNAYSKGMTSCLKGIIERFVLTVGKTVEIVCTKEEGCGNETYKALNDLLNTKFVISDAASKWFEEKATDDEIIKLTPAERKQHFIKYLIDESKRLRVPNEEYITKEISKYADVIDYSFEKLEIGGKNVNKTRRKRRKKKKNSAKSRKRNSFKKRLT